MEWASLTSKKRLKKFEEEVEKSGNIYFLACALRSDLRALKYMFPDFSYGNGFYFSARESVGKSFAVDVFDFGAGGETATES